MVFSEADLRAIAQAITRAQGVDPNAQPFGYGDATVGKFEYQSRLGQAQAALDEAYENGMLAVDVAGNF